MSSAIDDLALINSRLSTHLLELFEDLKIYSSIQSLSEGNSARGSAYFQAFDPESTSLKFPPLTVRFFQDAVKFNIVNNADAQEISLKMALCCRILRKDYKGAFSSILNNGVFKDFLSNEILLSDFLRKESVHGWCADAFASAFAWPVLPDIHLRAAGYRPINLSRRNILMHASGSYLHLINAVDLAIFGAWTGYSIQDIGQALSWLMNPTSIEHTDDVVLWPSRPAERLIIPLFSCGFQGAVFGFFAGLSSGQKEQVLKTVLHFGQSIADNYACLRRTECLDILRKSRDAKSVASALLRVVSPVEHIVAEVNGHYHSYSILTEDGYWAGYNEQKGHAALELYRKLASDSKCLSFNQKFMNEKLSVFVKPLQDHSSLDPIFTQLSLQARLSEILHVSDHALDDNPLTLPMLIALKEGLESGSALHADGAKSHGSLGRLKRLCIVEMILESFERGQVDLTNHTLKVRLERKLTAHAPLKLNGYQIAGRALEGVKNGFSEDFRRCVKFEAIGANKVRLSWVVK